MQPLLPELEFITWPEFHQMGFNLAQQLRNRHPACCTLISVARGGHVLARLLSDFLKLPIYSVSIQSYKDFQRHELHITQELNVDLKGRHVILVDEIIDSGKTLVRALEYLEAFETRSVTSVSVHVKPEAIRKSDLYVAETSKWVVYPYEVRETIEALRPVWKRAGHSDAALRSLLLENGLPNAWVDQFL